MADESSKVRECDMPEKFASWQTEARLAIVKVNKMDGQLNAIHGHTKNLSCLPDIAKELRLMRESLVGPATGRNRVDIITHLISVGVLVLALVLLLADRFDAGIKITEKGFQIERGTTKTTN